MQNIVNKQIYQVVLQSSRWISTTPRILKNVDMVDLPDMSAPIPEYKIKENEPLDLKRQRLLYQSRKRGMLENGLLLSTFAARYLDTFDEKQVNLYDKLINLPTNDWDIFYWATNVKPTPDEYSNEIMDLLKKHVSNENREQRLRQPDLYQKL